MSRIAPTSSRSPDRVQERRELQGLERKIAGDHWSQEADRDLIFSSEHGAA